MKGLLKDRYQETFAGEDVDELEWPSLGPVVTGPLCFSSIRFIVVLCFEIDNYLTPAHSSKITKSSHSAQYCRFQI